MVRIVYKLCMLLKYEGSTSNTMLVNKWWKQLWNLKIPNKIKHFVWKSYHNCIPSMVNLGRHHVHVDGLCPLCKDGLETTDHVIFQCIRAREIWDTVEFISMGIIDSQMDIKDRWLYIGNNVSVQEVEQICVGAWAIWNDRNNVTHSRPIPYVEI